MRFALALCAAFAALWAPLCSAESFQSVPVSDSALLSATFVLPHCEESIETLEDTFWAVSDPTSPQYQQHLSREEALELLKPCPHTSAALQSWIQSTVAPEHSHKVVVSPSGDIVKAPLTVAAVKAEFGDVKLARRRHPKDASQLLVAASVPVPAQHVLAPHVLGATVRLSGQVPNLPSAAASGVRAGGRRASADATQLFKYGWQSFPPPPFAVVEYLKNPVQDSLVIVYVPPCPSSPWQRYSMPLTYGDWPSAPSNPLHPCYGVNPVTHISFALVPLVPGHEVIQLASPLQCGARPYVFPVKSDDCYEQLEYELNLGLCVLDMPLTLPPNVPYTVNATQTMTDGSKHVYTYAAFNGHTLATVSADSVTPDTLRTLYNVPEKAYVGSCHKVKQAVAVPQPASSGFYSPSDVTAFSSLVGQPDAAPFLQFDANPYIPSVLQTMYEGLGLSRTGSRLSNNAHKPGGETTLDVETITAMGFGAVTEVYHGGLYGFPAEEDIKFCWGLSSLIEVVLMMEVDTNPPSVASFSYGWPALEVHNAQLLHFFDDHFMALGARGISVIVASGDQGAHDVDFVNQVDACLKPTPVYPGSSQYVTTVGATMFKSNGGHIVEEVVCSIDTGALITSGGGCSTYGRNGATLPPYQKVVVPQYMAKPLPGFPASVNRASPGRCYPDLALAGHNYLVVKNGQQISVDGTSAATPAFAGMVTLLNDVLARLYNHTDTPPTLGFLNTALYKAALTTPETFHDVVSGSNLCMGQAAASQCCSEGYVATSGYDAVSGLGTPQLTFLANALLPSNWTMVGFATDPTGKCAVPKKKSKSHSTEYIVIGVVVAVVAVAAAAAAFFVWQKRQKTKAGAGAGDEAYMPM